MKTKIYLIALTIIFFHFYCAELEEAIKKASESAEKEDDRDSAEGLPEEVRDLLSEENLRTIENGGVEIHRGDNPPLIEGVYYADTLTLEYMENDDSIEIGHEFDPYYIKFEGQSGGAITVSYKNANNTDSANGRGGYISGTGNDFTVFVDASGSNVYPGYPPIEFTAAHVYTGTLTPDGVANYKDSFLLIDKGLDEYDFMMPKNGFRIIKEDDGLAATADWPVD